MRLARRSPTFRESFRHEPLLYTPLQQGGHPRPILRASIAQTILRGLVGNLPRQGLLRETLQLLQLARRWRRSKICPALASPSSIVSSTGDLTPWSKPSSTPPSTITPIPKRW